MDDFDCIFEDLLAQLNNIGKTTLRLKEAHRKTLNVDTRYFPSRHATCSDSSADIELANQHGISYASDQLAIASTSDVAPRMLKLVSNDDAQQSMQHRPFWNVSLEVSTAEDVPHGSVDVEALPHASNKFAPEVVHLVLDPQKGGKSQTRKIDRNRPPSDDSIAQSSSEESRPSSVIAHFLRVSATFSDAAKVAKFKQQFAMQSSSSDDRFGWLSRIHHKGVFTPASNLRTFWSLLVCTTLLAWLIVAPTKSVVPEWDARPSTRVFDNIIMSVFVLDIFAEFNTAYIERRGHRDAVVYRRRKIAKRYLRGWFTMDVLSVIPYDLVLTDRSSSISLLKVLKLVRIARIGKIFKFKSIFTTTLEKWEDYLVDTCGASAMHMALSQAVTKEVLVLVMILVIEAHFAACLFLAIAAEGTRKPWTSAGEYAHQLPPGRRYCIALRFALSVLAIGTPAPELQEMMQFGGGDLICAALYVVFNAQLCTTLAAFVGFMGQKAKASGSDVFDSRWVILRQTLRTHNVPRILREEVDSHMREVRKCHDYSASKLFGDLSKPLTQVVRSAMFSVMFNNFKLFEAGSFTSTFQFQLCEIVELLLLKPTEPFIRKNYMLEGMFYIFKGSVALFHPSTDEDALGLDVDVSTLSLRTHGQYLCVEALFASARSHVLSKMTAISIESSELWILPRPMFDRILRNNPEAFACVNIIRRYVKWDDDEEGWFMDLDGQPGIDNLYHTGLPPEISEEIGSIDQKMSNDEAIVRSEDLGVCLEYVLNHFVADVQKEITVDIEKTSFRDLQEHFWGAGTDSPGFRDSQAKLCPRDGKPGCAIVDTLDAEHAGLAIYYLSWCWDYRLTHFCSSLRTWADLHSLKELQVFIWICFFCNNQRLLLLEKNGAGSHDLKSIFECRIHVISRRGGHMIIMLDTYSRPKYVGRVWCIFETFQATALSIKIELILPQHIQDELQTELRSGHFEEIALSFSEIDAANASAWCKEDEITIKAEITNTVGYMAINTVVRSRLREALSHIFQTILVKNEVPFVVQNVFGLLGGGHGTVLRDDLQTAVRRYPWLISLLRVSESSLDVAFESMDRLNREAITVTDLHQYLRRRHTDFEQAFEDILQSEWQDANLDQLGKQLIDNLQEQSETLLRKASSIEAKIRRLSAKTNGAPLTHWSI